MERRPGQLRIHEGVQDSPRGCLHGGRKILAPGRSQKADHPSAICFLYSVHMQRVVLVPSARTFHAER